VKKYSRISFLVCCAVDLSWIFGWLTSWHYGMGRMIVGESALAMFAGDWAFASIPSGAFFCVS
jgi:hypothetical protein